MKIICQHLLSFLFLLPVITSASEISTTASGVRTGGQFSIEYDESSETPPEHAYVFSRLNEGRIFERLITPLNVALHLPADIPVVIRNCEMVNAYFDINNNRIVFCNEFISEMIRKFETVYKTEEEVLKGIVGTVTFIFFHELGHALVTNLDLPITGRQEDAVDQLALFTMIFDQNPRDIELLMEAATYWGLYAEWEANIVVQEGNVKADLARIVFADEHSMGFQRFYNTLCWAYGSNVEANAAILASGYLPEARAQGCAAEYALLSDAWSRLLGKFLQGDNDEPLLRTFNGGGTIRVSYQETAEAAEPDQLIKLLKSNSVLESMTEPLAKVLVMPKDIAVMVTNCGNPDISFDSGASRITLCRELISDIAATFSAGSNGDFDAVVNGVIGTTLFYLYHQIGLALIQNLELPVTGIPTDAVDQLAVYFLVMGRNQEAASYLLAAADYFGLKSAQQIESGNDISGIYDKLTGQRFYNVLCWAYGSGDDAFEDIVDSGHLPEARAARCEAEFDLLSNSWNRLIGPYMMPMNARN